jgi:hypothetical protein
MTQPSTLLLAKQGDPAAIAVLMNMTLQPRGIHAVVQPHQETGHLEIVLTSDRWLNQQALVDFTRKGLVKLGVVSLIQVRLAAYGVGDEQPQWVVDIPFQRDAAQPSVQEAAAPLQSGPSSESQEAQDAGPTTQLTGGAASTGRPTARRGGRQRRPKRRSYLWLWGILVACLSFVAGGLGAYFARGDWMDGVIAQFSNRSELSLPGNMPVAVSPSPNPMEQQNQARTYLSTMNRAQQRFYEQNQRFAANLEELERSALVIARSYAYTYKLTVSLPNRAYLTGTPKASGLKSFSAVVQMPVSDQERTKPLTAICQSNSPSQIPPPLPKVAGNAVQCGVGSAPTADQ